MARPGRVGVVYPNWDVFQRISWRIQIDAAQTSSYTQCTDIPQPTLTYMMTASNHSTYSR